MKKWVIVLGILLVITLLFGCIHSSNLPTKMEEAKGDIKVGGKYFTEQLLLSKLTTIYLQEHGYNVEEISHMDTSTIRSALENNLIDLYWEYTATVILVHQQQKANLDFNELYHKAKDRDKQDGLIWLQKSKINNTYALLMRKELANKLSISTLSDLSHHINHIDDRLLFGTEQEFYIREDGIQGLEAKYGFAFPEKNVIRRDIGLLYDTLKEGEVDVAVGFATDPRIKAFNLTVLEDDQMFFLPYYAFPIIREEVYSEELNNLMNQLISKLDIETMTSLNHAVDMEYRDIAEISRLWLQEQGLIN